MPSQVKDFLDIIKEIRGTNFDGNGDPTEGFWFDVKTNAATVSADMGTVAADKAIVAADKAIVAADKATVAADKAIVAADKADVIAANAAAAINLDNIGDAFIVEVNALNADLLADANAVAAASLNEVNGVKNAIDAQVVVAGNHVTTASGYSTSAGVSATTATTKAAEATTARNYAYNWAQNAEDVGINDGVNPAGFSAYHWSQKAAALVGGVTDFTDLADCPASYATHGSKYLQVLPGETGVRFVSIVKGDIGLGSVDNTSDVDKPISSAVTTALSGKAPVAAKYIVQTLDSDLTNEQALGGLASGILYNTTTTGVLSIATASQISSNLLTGFVAGAGVVAATDTILQAFNKLDGNVSARATLTGANAMTGANTFTNATGQIFRQAATQDGILLRGRAGGTSSYTVEFIPATLTASRIVTAPDAATSLLVSAYSHTLSGPTTARTFTLPDANGTVHVVGQALGTPASGTLTNCTGLPAAGVTGTALVSAAIGTTVQGYDANTAKLNVDQAWTGSQRGTPTTDNDLSFDHNAANNFTCTPTAGGALTFTNHTAGQSGFILLVNNSNYAITAAATTKVTSTFLATISATGTYLISYYSNGTNTYCATAGAMA